MHPTATDLRRWEIPEIARFEDFPGGLVRLVVTSPLATAHIFVQGAHVTHFQPAGEEPALFLSEASAFAPGKAIRGGVPVIFPWFGARDGHPESPAHGVARTTNWEMESLAVKPSGDVELSLILAASERTRALWPHEFLLRHRVTIGRELTMELEVENSGSETFTFEEALHTYLAVGDVRESAITGLSGVEYLDKVDAFRRKTQDEAPIRITGETDRVYLNTTAACVADDLAGKRRLEVAKDRSATTVVWNPWSAKAKAMNDFGDDEWQRMLCIESANAAENCLTLPPAGKHRMRAVIRVSPRAE